MANQNTTARALPDDLASRREQLADRLRLLLDRVADVSSRPFLMLVGPGFYERVAWLLERVPTMALDRIDETCRKLDSVTRLTWSRSRDPFYFEIRPAPARWVRLRGGR